MGGTERRSTRGIAPALHFQELRERDVWLEGLVSTFSGSSGFSAAIIEGEPGMGKTALLDASDRMARQAGCTVLRARCSELETSYQYEVTCQLLERARQELDEPGGCTATRPGGRTASDDGGSTLGATAEVAQLHAEVSRLAARRPVVVIVDDLQWCDQQSSKSLSYLARRTEPSRIWLFGATLPHPSSSEVLAPDDIMAEPATRVLRLQPLGAESVAHVVRQLLTDAAPAQLIEECHVASGGNPFLLVSLLEELRRTGSLADARRPHIGDCAPAAVARSIRRRMASAPTDSWAVLNAIALLGDGADLASVARLAEVDTSTAVVAADAMFGMGLLRRERPFRFSYPLERTTVYQETSPAIRDRAHALAAELLAERGAPSEDVASHLLATEPVGTPWVIEQLDRCAHDLLDRGHYELAASCLERLLMEPLEKSERLGVLVAAAVAESHLGLSAALAHLHEASDLGAEPRALVRPAVRLAGVLQGRPERAALVDQIKTIAGSLGDDGDRTGDEPLSDETRLSLEVAALLVRPPEERALAAATITGLLGGRRTGTTRLERQALAHLSAIQADDPRQWNAEATADLARQLVDADPLVADDPVDVRTRIVALTTLARAGRFELVTRQALEGQAAVRASRQATDFAEFSNLLAYVLLLQGDLELAELECRRALAGVELSLGSVSSLETAQRSLGLLASVMWARGCTKDAVDILESGPMPEDTAGLTMLELHGQILVASGHAEDGLRALGLAERRAMEWSIQNPAVTSWRAACANALFLTGERDRAERLAQENLDLARAFGPAWIVGMALRAAARVADDQSDRTELLTEAVDVLEHSGATLEYGMALIDLGGQLSQQDELEVARDLLRRGADQALQCHATALVERAQQELRSAGGRPRRVALTGIAALTPMEQRVARLAIAGHPNLRIAEMLFVTNKTVEGHLSRVYRKLGIQSRHQLESALRSDDHAAGRLLRSTGTHDITYSV